MKSVTGPAARPTITVHKLHDKMSRDSSFSYVHLVQSHYSLYASNWVHDKLPNDPIEAPAIAFDFDEDNESASIQNSSFGAVKNKMRKDPVWKDLQLDKIMKDDPRWWKCVEDTSVLKVLEKAHLGEEDEEEVPSVGSSMARGNTYAGSSTGGASLQVPGQSDEITTPEMMRNRGGQRNAQNYQTPIGRIIR